MKMFVTDYDDTLYTSDEQILINIQKLKELHEKKFIIVIATGRSYSSIKRQVVERKIPVDYLVCADGSIIYNNKGEVIKDYPINKDIIEPFKEFYCNLDYDEIQFSYKDGYANKLEENEDILGINVCISTRLYNKQMEKDFYKLKKKYKNYNYLAYTHPNYSYLCVKPKDVTKSYAIDYLRKILNLKKSDLYLIGDSSNDVEMLKDFKGVGMKNSCQEVLKVVKKTYREVSDYLDEIMKDYEDVI